MQGSGCVLHQAWIAAVLTLCDLMLVKGAHRGLQLDTALNCDARALLLEAVQLFWHIDMLASDLMPWIYCRRFSSKPTSRAARLSTEA